MIIINNEIIKWGKKSVKELKRAKQNIKIAGKKLDRWRENDMKEGRGVKNE